MNSIPRTLLLVLTACLVTVGCGSENEADENDSTAPATVVEDPSEVEFRAIVSELDLLKVEAVESVRDYQSARWSSGRGRTEAKWTIAEGKALYALGKIDKIGNNALQKPFIASNERRTEIIRQYLDERESLNKELDDSPWASGGFNRLSGPDRRDTEKYLLPTPQAP